MKGLEGEQCHECRHRRGWNCHRYPPVVTQPSIWSMERGIETPSFDFPPAGQSCGEFELLPNGVTQPQ